MATDIQIHEHQQKYLGPVQTFEDRVEEPEARSRVDLLGVLRRRWLMILLIWLIPAIPAVIAIARYIEPTYTATGQIMVEPVQDSILPDHPTQPTVHNFESYLLTQAELLLSTRVLNWVIGELPKKTPELSILEAEDPLLAIRQRSEAVVLPRSFLINLSVTMEDPQEAMQLASAILESYMILVGDQGESERKHKVEILTKMKEELEQELQDANRRITELSRTYSASSEAQFTVIREAREQEAVELRSAFRSAEQEVDQLQYQLNAMERRSVGAELNIPDDFFEQRNTYVNNDPTVLAIRQQITEVSQELERLRSGLLEGHEKVVRTREDLDRLRETLQRERERSGQDFDRQMENQSAQRSKEQRSLLERDLERARNRHGQLARQVKELESQILDMGRIGVSIEEAKAQREFTQSKYDQVVKALDNLSMKKRLPSRIKEASQPEIRPNGFNDPRKKLIVMTVGGCFCFAFALALLREHRDHSLHETEELKQINGVPFLGAVPALRDLEQGLVGQEDFAESYRAIRTALSGRTRGRPDKSFLVTSARSGEGKTSLAISLAISFTEPGHRVLLIDGDTQVPNASRVLKVRPPFGLREALLGERAARECVVPTGIANLDVLVCQANGQSLGGLLDSRTAENVINALGDSYDYIILDSPPALSAADALVWATVADGVVLSSFIGATDRVAMQMTCERLEAVGARIVGSVAANVPRNSRFYSYSTTSYERRQNGGDGGAPQHPLLISHQTSASSQDT